ncbi:MAG: hypothetical protein MRY74_15565 [Neomegalonema sp.]|nr:hypothetical protein [Neomegalonema sp.]
MQAQAAHIYPDLIEGAAALQLRCGGLFDLGAGDGDNGLVSALANHADSLMVEQMQLGPTGTILRMRAVARSMAGRGGASGGLNLIVLQAAYAVDPGGLSLSVARRRRLWGAGVGAALQTAAAKAGADNHAAWMVVVDGPCARPSGSDPSARRRVAAALADAFGAPEENILAVARAPGDCAPLAPRLARALSATIFPAGAPNCAGAPIPTKLAAAANWVSRIDGTPAIMSVAPDGRAPLLPRPASVLSLPGVVAHGAELNRTGWRACA